MLTGYYVALKILQPLGVIAIKKLEALGLQFTLLVCLTILTSIVTIRTVFPTTITADVHRHRKDVVVIEVLGVICNTIILVEILFFIHRAIKKYQGISLIDCSLTILASLSSVTQ